MNIIRRADILLPNTGDMTAWSTVACDQFTSEPEYWQQVEKLVGDKPSALHLMLPEAWLEKEKAKGAEERIAMAMKAYQEQGVFRKLENSFVYMERTQPDGRVRRGLICAIDLESYDFRVGSTSPIRATEGTVEERLPPRVRVRQGATLEMPHVMVLMDDRDDRVLGPLEENKDKLPAVYDFDLMMGGGHLRGWQVAGETAAAVELSLVSLGTPESLRAKYGDTEKAPVIFAIGDGNHSLAAARLCWEQRRETLSPAERENDPARFALVELVNIHEKALDFEPIHRVLFDTDTSAFSTEYAEFMVAHSQPDLTVGEYIAAAETFCKNYVQSHGGRLDYIHGDETAAEMGERPNCAAVILPPLDKAALFSSVLESGAFPRKSFSMGHARDKRYYLECRCIVGENI